MSWFPLQVIHLVRPLRCNDWCCFCCLQEMEVQSPPGTTVGWIKQEFSFIYPKFSIQNANGDTILTIKGPCWTCKWCDVEFQVCTRCVCFNHFTTYCVPPQVMSADGSQEVGKISKQWSGLAKEFFSDADNFGIQCKFV